MKKLLFSLALSLSAFISNFDAQVRTWDFNDSSKWTTADLSYTTDYDGLKFVMGASAFSGFTVQNAGPFSDGYSATQRLQFGGNSYGGSDNPTSVYAAPTRRYLELAVTGKSTIKLWARGGGANRTIIVSDKIAGSVIGFGTFTSNTDIQIFTINYTGSATTLIIATGSGDNSLFKIEATNTETMATNSSNTKSTANVFSNNNKIYVKDLDSKNTQISVYTANGTLVKSLKSNVDTNLEISAKGLYFVNLKSEDGEKSVKVLIK